MHADAKNQMTAYQRVFQGVPWKAYPFEEKTSYADDDTRIRALLRQLRQLDPTTPPPRDFESAPTNMHYVMVGYEQDLVLYWFQYFIQEGDRGYLLYRIRHFTEPSFNFQDYSHRFNLPESSMAKVYMEVFSRLNDWARMLDLPYRYEVDLRNDYMGYVKNKKPIPATVHKPLPVDNTVSFWRRLWARWRA